MTNKFRTNVVVVWPRSRVSKSTTSADITYNISHVAITCMNRVRLVHYLCRNERVFVRASYYQSPITFFSCCLCRRRPQNIKYKINRIRSVLGKMIARAHTHKRKIQSISLAYKYLVTPFGRCDPVQEVNSMGDQTKSKQIDFDSQWLRWRLAIAVVLRALNVCHKRPRATPIAN